MAEKQVRWTSIAFNDKIEILEYWVNRNQSTTFSEKLDLLIDNALDQVKEFPDHGKKTEYKNIRIKIVRSYLMYYLVENDFITVVRIWDPKKDPKEFKLG